MTNLVPSLTTSASMNANTGDIVLSSGVAGTDPPSGLAPVGASHILTAGSTAAMAAAEARY